jgi:hypothetical protein
MTFFPVLIIVTLAIIIAQVPVASRPAPEVSGNNNIFFPGDYQTPTEEKSDDTDDPDDDGLEDRISLRAFVCTDGFVMIRSICQRSLPKSRKCRKNKEFINGRCVKIGQNST